MHKLTNQWMEYDWGSPDAIPLLMGRTPGTTPVAEVWMGAHEAAPSQVEIEGERISLHDLIAARPRHTLGDDAEPGVANSSDGARLPFMMKFLAARRSLSLQVHPSREEAVLGFAREESAGLAVDHPARSFRDRSAKPEMIYALGPFELLAGFRDPRDIRSALRTLITLTGAAYTERVVEPLYTTIDALEHPTTSVALQHGFGTLLRTPIDLAVELVSLIADAAQQEPDLGPDVELVLRLAEEHPRDMGAIAALFLARHRLSPGEALFVDAGVVHTYLSGLGVEVMATSDNVLRAGLTSKHVSVPDVLAHVRFATCGVQPLHGVPSLGGTHFAPPIPDFSLWTYDGHLPGSGGELVVGPPSGPRVLASCGSPATVMTESEVVTLAPGESVFIPDGDGPIRIMSRGPVAIALPGKEVSDTASVPPAG